MTELYLTPSHSYVEWLTTKEESQVQRNKRERKKALNRELRLPTAPQIETSGAKSWQFLKAGHGWARPYGWKESSSGIHF